MPVDESQTVSEAVQALAEVLAGWGEELVMALPTRRERLAVPVFIQLLKAHLGTFDGVGRERLEGYARQAVLAADVLARVLAEENA